MARVLNLRGTGQRSSLRSPACAVITLGLTQLAGREPHIWRVIGQNTPYMAVGMTQLGPNCVTPKLVQQRHQHDVSANAGDQLHVEHAPEFIS